MTDNKRKSAVALEYGNNPAPLLTAKGYGEIAEKIIALAHEHQVYTHEDEGLSQLLATLSVGDEIPETLYYAIAEIIAFVYAIEGRFPKNWNNEANNAAKKKVNKSSEN